MNVIRCLGRDRRVIQIIVHIRQDRLLGRHPRNPFKRIGQMRMCRVRLAAQRRTQRELIGLREIVATMDEQVSDGVHPVDTDREFHRAIAAAAHNPVLLQAMEALAQQMSGPEWHRIKLWGLRGTEQTARIQGQHRRIFAAIEAADADLAEALMKEHIDRIIDDVHAAEQGKRATE